MSGTTGANLPVRIEVEGTQQAEAQFNRVGQAGQAAMQRVQGATEAGTVASGRFSQAVGAAGFQVQDFAVQVQAGQSAVLAFSQQASQFLGIFGTGGAIAGAVLTVGLLAYQLSGLAETSEDAGDATRRLAEAEEAYQNALRTTIELTETADQRAARLLQTRLDSAQIGFIEQRNQLEGLRFFVNREIEEARRLEQAPVAVDPFGAGREFIQGNPGQQTLIQGYLAQLDAISEALARVDEAQRRLLRAGGDQGQGQFGPFLPTPERPERPDMSEINAQLQDFRRLAADRDRLIRENETALERYNRRIDEITALATAARLNGNPIPEETIRRATEAALADFERMEEATQRNSQLANQLGFSFSSAFEDAIIKGKSFSEVLKGLEQDIARIIIRTAITQPFGNALAGGVNSAMGSFSFANLFAGPSGAGSGNTFATVAATGGTFAMGGIMTPNGPLPLNRYASGGIANSPQIALFGEGRMPEAYVPLPDGRRIPVAMQGGGGVTFAPTYNIDARGADASMVPRLRAEMVAIARASNAELLDSIQRGGSAARIVGRRA